MVGDESTGHFAAIRIKADIRNPIRCLQNHKESFRKRIPPCDFITE